MSQRGSGAVPRLNQIQRYDTVDRSPWCIDPSRVWFGIGGFSGVEKRNLEVNVLLLYCRGAKGTSSYFIDFCDRPLPPT